MDVCYYVTDPERRTVLSMVQYNSHTHKKFVDKYLDYLQTIMLCDIQTSYLDYLKTMISKFPTNITVRFSFKYFVFIKPKLNIAEQNT